MNPCKTTRTTLLKIVPIYFIFAVFFIEHSFADLIILKNGRRLQGAIISTTGDSVTMDIGIGETTINKNDIKSIERKKEDNAAIYYLRALDLADYGNAAAGKNKIAKFEKANFHMPKAELEELLNNNKKCLDEIGKGLAIKKCDFYFEDKYDYTRGEERKDNQRKIMYLHSLLLLNGRRYEDLKDPDHAVDAYLSALTFARQISQGRDPEFQMAAIMIEKNAYPLIMDYLNSKDTDPKLCGKIFAYIDDHEKEHFSAKVFFESSKEAFIRPFNSFSVAVTRWARETPDLNDDVRANAQKFADELLKGSGDLADKYYGNFIKAAQTGADKDWESAVSEYAQLVKDVKPPEIEDDIDLSIFMHKELGKIEEYNKKDPKLITVTILSAQLPYYRTAAEHYRENCKELKKIKSLAAKKMETTHAPL